METQRKQTPQLQPQHKLKVIEKAQPEPQNELSGFTKFLLMGTALIIFFSAMAVVNSKNTEIWQVRQSQNGQNQANP